MEWMKGGEQPQTTTQPAGHTGGSKKSKGMKLRVVSVALLFGVTILIVALLGLVANGGTKAESKFVDGGKLQAVFLNGGQVYFGNIKDLNEKYVQMNNIYYLRVNQTVQPNQASASGQQAAQNDISLVKLGCELHGPTDEMQINRDQVIFWENLKDDGQVAKAVADYKKQNPNGQNCNTQQSQSTGTSNGSSTGTGTTKKQ
jgi:hypothetical protein